MDRKTKAELEQEAEEQRQAWTRNLFAHIKKVIAIKKPCIDDSESIKRACEDYFSLCEEDGVAPTIAGLSRALGVTRDTLMKWLHGEITIKTADVVMEYFSLIEIFDETALKGNKTNAVAGLFNMKNNYGYKDEVEHKIIDERKPTIKEIAEKYGKRAEIIDAQPSGAIDYTEQEEEQPPAVKEMVGKGLLNDKDDEPF